MALTPDDLGEAALVARVGDVIADAATEGRRRAGDDPRQAARRVAIGIALGMLKASQPQIAAHSDDVGIVADAIARWLGVSGQGLEDLMVAARLHDIGKLAFPDELLNKDGPLDPVELAAIRRHPIIGEQILVPVPELRAAARLVRHSHERWDGFGYPDGLLGKSIPLGSRIIACADAYATIRAGRPYRAGSSVAVALAELRDCAGTQFDPAVVDALEDLARGLRIAGDRSQPQGEGVSRVMALLLIICLGTAGGAVARSGVLPEPKAKPRSAAAVVAPRPAVPPGAGTWAAATGAAESSGLLKIPTLRGPGGPDGRQEDSVIRPDKSRGHYSPQGSGAPASPGGGSGPGSADKQGEGRADGGHGLGDDQGHGGGQKQAGKAKGKGNANGNAKGKGKGNANGNANGHGQGGPGPGSAPPATAGPGNGNGSAGGAGNPTPKKPKPPKPAKPAPPGPAGSSAPSSPGNGARRAAMDPPAPQGNGNGKGNGNAHH